MSTDSISAAELTYLELTAEYAPAELPASSALVLRLLQELEAAKEELREVESMHITIDDLESRIAELETDHKSEVRELHHEIQTLEVELRSARAFS